MESLVSSIINPNRDTTTASAVIPYPPIEQHGLIGDRRTAALVASDGTIDWLCLPDYDGTVLFGALLDWSKSGYWRVGPTCRVQGEQSYIEDTWVLQTKWDLETGSLILSDTMLWPQTTRSSGRENVRPILRHLKCTKGEARVSFDLYPAINFSAPSATFTSSASGFSLELSDFGFGVWANFPLEPAASRLSAELDLQAGEELWTVLELGAAGQDWTVESARSEFEKAQEHGRAWLLLSRRVRSREARTFPGATKQQSACRFLNQQPFGRVQAGQMAGIKPNPKADLKPSILKGTR